MSIEIPSKEDLKRLREAARLTQKSLAERAGVSQSLIARIESGSVDPRLSTLKKILDVLLERKREAGAFMRSPVLQVDTSDTVRGVVNLMERYGISQLPVLNQGTLVGSVDEATLLKVLSKSKSPSTLFDDSIGKFMGVPPPTVSATTPMKSVLALLRDKPAVLVMDGRGRPEGIITKIDVLTSLRT